MDRRARRSQRRGGSLYPALPVSIVDRLRVQAVLGYLAAGLNPNQAAREAGVSKTVAYELDREVTGVPRLAAGGRRARRGRGLPGERVRLLLDQLASLTS